MCGGGGSSRKKTNTPATPPVNQTIQDMIRALEIGPTGYSEAMRVNLGIDAPTGGPKPQSGMAGQVPSFTGYDPVAATPDPVRPAMPVSTAPTTFDPNLLLLQTATDKKR